ncbi:MAG: precorrin-2 C(20)-methyltransferase [Chloroflexota bacterium]
MTGILYGVGVGPGDPELLTLKAARIIGETPVVAAPIAKAGAESYALSIVSALLRPEQTVLELLFPMVKEAAAKQAHRQAAAQAIVAELLAGRDVAFLTEGDPLLHSTFIYVLQYLPDDAPVEVVPGVSSIMAAAAQARLPLVNADQRLAVIPTTFERLADLRQIFRDFDTVVLLKFHRLFEPLLDLLDELGLSRQTVLVERASHPAGRVVRDIRSLRGQSIHYLSLLIVPTNSLSGGDW